MKVKDILRSKGPAVFTIGEENSLAEAVGVLSNNNIGVLLVLNTDAKLVGVVSERDILHKCNIAPDTFLALKVRDVMTRKIIVVEPDDEIEYAESVITNNRIRHLPVVHNKVLVGLISIGDVVKAMLTGARYENKYLLDYISGNIPKG